MVEEDNIGLAFCELVFSIDTDRATDQGQPDAHPDPGHDDEIVLTSRVGQKVSDHRRNENDQECDDETDQSPKGPDPCENVEEYFFHGQGVSNFQSIGARPWPTNFSLVLEK